MFSKIGFTSLFLSAGSLVLPLLGLQWKIFGDDFTAYSTGHWNAVLILGGIGIGLIFIQKK